MRRAIQEIRATYGDRFAIGALSMQGLLKETDGDEVFFHSVPAMFREAFAWKPAAPAGWDEWREQFAAGWAVRAASWSCPRWWKPSTR